MIKIEIKHWITGSILFEYSKENNTIKDTIIEAVKNKAYLQGAYLRGAYLQGAYLRGAYLQGAYLQGAYLRGAYLRGADLRGADLRGEKIENAIVFNGLYKYEVMPYITKLGIKRIKMGCHNRTLDEWTSDFWNNDDEFPNNDSLDSNLRLMAFETAKKWFELIDKTK